jgi:hypothetical protein
MADIRLEFEKLEMLTKKSKWKLYFIIVAEDPTDNDKMLVTQIPSAGRDYFRMKKSADNIIPFEPESEDGGVDGLFVLERDMPADKRISVEVYLMHNRSSARQMGDVLSDMKGKLGTDVLGTVSNVLGSTSPWLVVAKSAISVIGSFLKNVKDRDFGVVTMHEEFGDEFDQGKKELDRANTFSTGEAKLRWSWRVRK